MNIIKETEDGMTLLHEASVACHENFVMSRIMQAKDVFLELQDYFKTLQTKLYYLESMRDLPDDDDRALAGFEYGEIKLLREILGIVADKKTVEEP